MSCKKVCRRQVPSGWVVVNERLLGSELHTTLIDAHAVKVHLEGDLGDVDVFPSPDVACVYLPEPDVINITAAVQARLAALAKSFSKGVVFAECTRVSEQYFGTLQELATLQLNLVTIPVESQAVATRHIIQMVKQQTHPERVAARHPPVDNELLQVVRTLPKTGAVKANALISKYGSMKNISQASVEDLAATVGKPSAVAIHNYFHQPIAGKGSK